MKLFLKIFGITLSAIIVTVVLIGLFYGDEIKQLLLTNLNKNLKTEIRVRKIDFSILHHFPFASVELENIVAKDALDSSVEKSKQDTLLQAEHLSLLFNLTEIFSKNISIKKIILKNGTVHVCIDENGKNNYHFWKSSTDTSSSVIDLEKIVLENVKMIYSNIRDHQKYIFTAKDGKLSGKFSADKFELKTDADLTVDHFYAGKTDYAQKKNVKIKSTLKVNTANGTYQFEKSQLNIADLLFDVDGDIHSENEKIELNIHINSHEAELKNFLSLLPTSSVNYFSKFNSKGQFVFQSTISGDVQHHSPDIKFSFSLAHGSLSPKESSVVLNDLDLNGTFLHSSSKPEELTINSFNGKLNGREVGGNLKVSDFENPFLILFAKADLDLNSLRAFIKHDTLESLSGNMKLNVSFAGKVKDLQQYASSGNYRSHASGNISLENVSFKLKQNPLDYKNINGNFLLHNNNVEVQTLNGKISSTDFHLQGSLNNFITFLLIPNQEVIMDISVSSSLIDLNEILENKTTTADEDTSYKIKINPRLVCNLKMSADKIIFRKFEATNISGFIRIEDQIISSPNLSFNAMEGSVNMSATIATARRDSVLMGCKAKVSQLNITKLFSELENFGEQTITDKNLLGTVSAEVVFNSSWTKDLTINPAKVVTQADITIENGELNDFKPMLALSKYLKLADLKHIKFSTLKNLISIHDRKLFFPTMEIKSSALNLNASGTHDFDNMVDYKLNMLLSDVLGKKMKEQNSEFGTIEDDGLGRTKLFFTMKGAVDNPKFSYDSKSASQKIASNLKTDQQNIKQLVKQEFGLFKKDTTIKEQKRKREEMQIDWDDKPEKE